MTLSQQTQRPRGSSPGQDPCSPSLTPHDLQEEQHPESEDVSQEDAEAGPAAAAAAVVVGKEGDVKSLLNFVNVASGDIRAALDKSAPLKRCVDHRKYLQRQLKRFTGGGGGGGGSNTRLTAATTAGALNQSTHDKHCGSSSNILADKPAAGTGCGASQQGLAVPGNRVRTTEAGALQSLGTCPMATDGAKEDLIGGKRLDLHLQPNGERQQFARRPATEADDYRLSRPHTAEETMAGAVVVMDKTTDSKTTHENSESTDKEVNVSPSELSDPLFERLRAEGGAASGKPGQTTPLRQRQLPASFWQEPSVPRMSNYVPGDHMAYAKYHGSHALSPVLYKDMLQGAYASALAAGHYGYVSSPDQHRLSSLPGDCFYQTVSGKYGGEIYTYSPWTYGPSSLSPSSKLSPHSAAPQTLGTFNNAAYVLQQRAGARAHEGSPPTGASAPSALTAHGWTPPGGGAAALRTPIWRPIPTKSAVAAYSSRYHPFANVH